MSQANIFVLPGAKESREAFVTSPCRSPTLRRYSPATKSKFSKVIAAEDVEAFAKLSGDRNPLHMDENFASRTHFQRRVVHGMLVANYVSALVGMSCPGPGALWSQQNFRWPAPVFIGDRIDLTLRVTHKSVGARTLKIEAKALNQDGKVVMEGEGTVTALEERQQTKEAAITERVAFVSGGARGIGAAIASALAKAGAMVVVNYRKNDSAADELCSAIRTSGGRAIPVRADVTDQASVVAAVARARQEFNRPVDILVNNAGSLPEPRPFTQTTWEEVQSIIDVHVRGAFHCCSGGDSGDDRAKIGTHHQHRVGFYPRHTPRELERVPSGEIGHAIVDAHAMAAELGPHGHSSQHGFTGTRGNGIDRRIVGAASQSASDADPVCGGSRRRLISQPWSRRLCTEAGDFVTGAEIPVCGGFQM